MRRLFIIAAVLALSCRAQAAPRIAWDQPDDTDLATVQRYTYTLVLDAGTRVPLVNVVCTGAPLAYTCIAPLPPLALGSQSVRIVASNGQAPDAVSGPLTFTITTPARVTGPRMVGPQP